MITSREDFLMTLLKCGQLDLQLIDGVEYDWCDILDNAELNGNYTLPAVMSAVFSYGKQQIEEAIEYRISYLEDTEKNYGISDEQKEELTALRALDPYEDLEEYHNYIDTHITCIEHKDAYRKYLQKELDDFAEGTGYEVEF